MRSKEGPPARAVNARDWTYRIFSAAELAAVFDFTPDAFSAALGPEEVAGALREAGAPEPWQNPTAAVGRIDNFVPVGISQAYREVRAALRKLQKFLPSLIEEFEQQLQSVNAPERFPRILGHRTSAIIHVRYNEHLGQFQELKSSLDRILEELSLGKEPTASWHANAVSLYRVYCEIVGPKSGISADGPAVRFVQIVLNRLTGDRPEKDAIEAALRNWKS
jgi:hypothetical protein